MRYHQGVRTTISLDPAIHAALKELAEREGTTLGRIVERLYAQEKQSRRRRSKFELSRAGLPLLPERKGLRVTTEMVKELLESSESGSRTTK